MSGIGKRPVGTKEQTPERQGTDLKVTGTRE
jgi:hypothetical protein